jgi:hypothetical protein
MSYLGRGGGTGELEVFGEREVRRSTFTCSHCNSIVIVRPKEDPANLGGHCKICDKLICPHCNAKGGCTPWEKQMERMEARYRFRRDAGLTA